MGTWGLVSAPPVTATAEVESTPTPSGPSLSLVGTVVVRDLPARASAGHPAQHKPFLTPRPRTPGTSAPANGTVAVNSAGPGGGGTTASPRTAVLSAPSPTTPTVTAAFPRWAPAQTPARFHH